MNAQRWGYLSGVGQLATQQVVDLQPPCLEVEADAFVGRRSLLAVPRRRARRFKM